MKKCAENSSEKEKRLLNELAARLDRLEVAKDDKERFDIANRLYGAGDPRGLDVLWSFYEEYDISVVEKLVWFIMWCSDEVFEKCVDKVFGWFMEALKNNCCKVREEAVNGLCEIAMRCSRYRDKILEILSKVALKDSWRGVRAAALECIVAIRYGWDRVSEVRAQIFKLRDGRDVSSLLKFLDTDEPYFRRVAVWSLYRLCEDLDKSLCKHLLKLVNDKYPCLRLIGLHAYWLYFGEEAKDVLMKLVCDENPEVRVEAAKRLLELTRKGVLRREEIEFIKRKLYEILSGDVDEIIEDDTEDLLDEFRDFLF